MLTSRGDAGVKMPQTRAKRVPLTDSTAPPLGFRSTMKRIHEKPKWLQWSLRSRRLTKASIRDSGLTKKTIDRIKKTDRITPAQKTKLRSAYLKTQYNKLRKAGVNRKEAYSIAKKRKPENISETVKNRKQYVEEMIFRKGEGIRTRKDGTLYVSKRAWDLKRKMIFKALRKKDYTENVWAKFVEWYQTHTKKFIFPKAQEIQKEYKDTEAIGS